MMATGGNGKLEVMARYFFKREGGELRLKEGYPAKIQTFYRGFPHFEQEISEWDLEIGYSGRTDKILMKSKGGKIVFSGWHETPIQVEIDRLIQSGNHKPEIYLEFGWKSDKPALKVLPLDRLFTPLDVSKAKKKTSKLELGLEKQAQKRLMPLKSPEPYQAKLKIRKKRD